MAEVIILDELTVNKIAAGEVVERPVNVVKELVENAIDADSSNISIEIKGGGIDYIRVTDNGSGIEKSSIPTAFLRHATSKIRSVEDLLTISSLGFRGEALSSIAAVSRIELMTKTADALLGYCYVIEGGREMSFDEAGVPEGTTIIVRNLFYNTPARKKFLKSATTEAGYVTELIERLILSHPSVAFKYTVNGSVKLSSDGLSDSAADLYSVFGRDIQKALVEVSYDNEACSLSGYVGKPEISRGNKNFEIFFVNGRYVKSRVLSSAVEEAYKPYLMQHRFPFVVMYLIIPSEMIDVNVHPAKTEIKFSDERGVYSCVFDAATEGITRRELIPEVKYEEPSVPSDSTNVFQKQDAPKPEKKMIPEPFETKKIEEIRRKSRANDFQNRESFNEAGSESVQETLFKEGFLEPEKENPHRIVGQVFDTYWIIEYDGKMYIIDQHAAHEKILYERLSKQIREGEVLSQMISPPYIVSLTASQEDTVKANLDAFEQMGFRIEHFGGREYALSSVPCELFRMNAEEYFLSVVDDLSENSRIREPEAVKDRIATMSCKAAVKGNMKMSYREAEALIDELLKLDNPYNCPHGRPTIITFSKTELEKLFKRIV